MSEIREYYADCKKQTFYQKYWGGESIHVGIYLENYQETRDDDLGEFIRDASRFKSKVMANLVKSYMTTYKYTFDGNGNKIKFNIADWGSGYGGTARVFSKLWGNLFNVSVSCYDLSDKNCEYNAKINALEEFSDITIYNQSFLEIENRWFDVIYSEDAFVHLDDKETIFKRAYENLNKDGFLIFSDIILKNPDTCDKETLDEICRRISVSNIGSKETYLKCAIEAGFTLCNYIGYDNDIKQHYKHIKKFYIENESTETRSDEIVQGLDDWIRHADNDNITMGIFIFKKDTKN